MSLSLNQFFLYFFNLSLMSFASITLIIIIIKIMHYFENRDPKKL